MTNVAKPIKPKFITPPTNASIIRSQQQPKQYKPTLKPTIKEATKLPFQSFKKNKSGCLHLCKQAFLDQKIDKWLQEKVK